MVCGILLAGCAGSGESMMITDDTALISVSGANGDSRDKLVSASLLEAARTTQAHGYRFFTVLAADDAPRVTHKIVPPAYIYQTGFTDPRADRAMMRAKRSDHGNLTPVGESVAYARPGLDITIRMYREGEIDPAKDGVWNSATILATPAPAR